MSARSMMTMRAVIQRTSGTGIDGSGDPTRNWATLSTTPCFVIHDERRAVFDEGQQRYLEIIDVIIPLDTDVTPADRVLKITDRLGVKKWGKTADGADVPMLIDAPLERNPDHMTMKLRLESAGTRAA